MLARHASICPATGRRIEPGDEIRYDRRMRRFVLANAGALHVENERGRYISDVIRIGGKEYYRNKRGRCEDAPCCGCCTI